ncbi:unnamed protein product [Rotaria sp. Silwood2]|nr:unnamed protein product [Rotaria sp. Silwood2]
MMKDLAKECSAKQCLLQLLDEEQQRESEQALEEERPSSVTPFQSIAVNISTFKISPLIGYLSDAVPFLISLEWLVHLLIFNGTLYFETVDEQTVYYQCLSLCPKPRSMEEEEEEAFKNGRITVNGFVSSSEYRHHLHLHQVQFHSNLLTFIKQIIENRNNSHAFVSSYVDTFILNSFKLI